MTSSEENARGSPEDDARLHRESFRCAFDFLNAHFPPGQGEDWWVQTVKDAVKAISSVNGNRKLAEELVMGVYSYLEDDLERRKKDGGPED